MVEGSRLYEHPDLAVARSGTEFISRFYYLFQYFVCIIVKISQENTKIVFRLDTIKNLYNVR